MRKFKNILAIETSGLFCSVALKSNGKIKHKVTDRENEHGLVILDFIEDLLIQSDVKKESLDLIGWETRDIYQNLIQTFLSDININIDVEEKIFSIQKYTN